MIPREAASKALQLAAQYPVLTITGPRQSGKTTLCRMINVKDLSKFEVFLRMCAGRAGQVINLSSLGNDCGVNHATVKTGCRCLKPVISSR